MTESPIVPGPFDHHGGPRPRGLGAPLEPQADTGRFRWLVEGLEPLKLPDDALAALAATMVDESGGGGWSGQPTPADNPALPAGYTYLVQFVDHDITFDPTSRLDRAADAVRNFRTPRFDLVSVYGGPKASPYLYDRNDQALLLVDGAATGPRLAGLDLPRNSQERAVTGDPRNDLHVIISQLHLAFLAFHNNVVGRIRSDPALRWGDESDFQTACRLVRWHYQWIVLHDLLPRIVGPQTVEAVLARKGKRYAPRLKLYNRRFKDAYVPVEFSAAAYRFGHSPWSETRTSSTAATPARSRCSPPTPPTPPAPTCGASGGCRTTSGSNGSGSSPAWTDSPSRPGRPPRAASSRRCGSTPGSRRP